MSLDQALLQVGNLLESLEPSFFLIQCVDRKLEIHAGKLNATDPKMIVRRDQIAFPVQLPLYYFSLDENQDNSVTNGVIETSETTQMILFSVANFHDPMLTPNESLQKDFRWLEVTAKSAHEWIEQLGEYLGSADRNSPTYHLLKAAWQYFCPARELVHA